MTEQKFSFGLKMIWLRHNKDSRPITFGPHRPSGLENLQDVAGLDIGENVVCFAYLYRKLYSSAVIQRLTE
jgi:hypothetical protein